MFPPGNISTQPPPATGFERLAASWPRRCLASPFESGDPVPQGTSFLLRILPYIEGDSIASHWNFTAGITSTGDEHRRLAPSCNYNLAVTDIKGFYCPTRRNGVRSCDVPLMLPTYVLPSRSPGPAAGPTTAAAPAAIRPSNTQHHLQLLRAGQRRRQSESLQYNPTVALGTTRR